MENKTEEIRIDVSRQTAEELALAKEHAQLVFRLNHTMPMTEEYDTLLHRIFPDMGAGSVVNTPLTAVRPHCVKIGRNVVVMNGCLMMAAGGIIIDDEAQIAANVQLISNNHDLDNRQVITCRPVHIGRRTWIGAGSHYPAGCHHRREQCGRCRQRCNPRCGTGYYRGGKPCTGYPKDRKETITETAYGQALYFLPHAHFPRREDHGKLHDNP